MQCYPATKKKNGYERRCHTIIKLKSLGKFYLKSEIIFLLQLKFILTSGEILFLRFNEIRRSRISYLTKSPWMFNCLKDLNSILS